MCPFRGVYVDSSSDGGGDCKRGIVSTFRGCLAGESTFPKPQAAARLLHDSTTWLPLCFFVLQEFRLGRRHYHIALRGSRHLTAGTREPGGRQAVKSTSGWSIEPLGCTAPRGTPSSPSTNERLRLGPERPPIPGGPRWSPRWGGGPGTVPVRRGRHFTRG